MSHSALPFIPDIDITGGSRKNREDDLPPLKRKKKHKNNDLSLFKYEFPVAFQRIYSSRVW